MRLSARRFLGFLAFAIAFSLAVCVLLPAGSAGRQGTGSREAAGALDAVKSGEPEISAVSQSLSQRGRGASAGGFSRDSAWGAAWALRAVVSSGPVLPSIGGLSCGGDNTLVSRRVRLNQ
jgi:hypothetical protein